MDIYEKMVNFSKGKPFTFNARIKFNDDDSYEEKRLCFAKPKTIDRLAANENFDNKIFYYVSSIEEAKSLMEDNNGNDFKIVSVIADTMETIDF